MAVALSIAGSDPTGGAGLQLDVQVFHALGVRGAGVPTALTIQDTRAVHRVLPIFPSVVLDQLRVVLRDLEIAAVKIGMLATDDVARSVQLALSELPASTPLVVDPVLRASSGAVLLEQRAWPTLCEILGRAALVTPNVPELESLVGQDASERRAIEAAARRMLGELGARAVLVTGGHRKTDADDLLAIREPSGETRIEWLPAERIPGDPVHGTGCALSSAVAAELARGTGLIDAVARARAFVRAAIGSAQTVGHGARLLGIP
jgi:hydroxymethylpyrimidine/phosphomethylpyrimidine kinase